MFLLKSKRRCFPEDQTNGDLLDDLQRRLLIRCRHDVVAFTSQDLTESPKLLRIVVDDENVFVHCHSILRWTRVPLSTRLSIGKARATLCRDAFIPENDRESQRRKTMKGGLSHQADGENG